MLSLGIGHDQGVFRSQRIPIEEIHIVRSELTEAQVTGFQISRTDRGDHAALQMHIESRVCAFSEPGPPATSFYANPPFIEIIPDVLRIVQFTRRKAYERSHARRARERVKIAKRRRDPLRFCFSQTGRQIPRVPHRIRNGVPDSTYLFRQLHRITTRTTLPSAHEHLERLPIVQMFYSVHDLRAHAAVHATVEQP